MVGRMGSLPSGSEEAVVDAAGLELGENSDLFSESWFVLLSLSLALAVVPVQPFKLHNSSSFWKPLLCPDLH